MKTNNIFALLGIAACCCLASCDNSQQKMADSLLKEAEQLFNKGEYDKALTKIDSLRNIYPNAIETRKKALGLYQSIALEQAQEDLANTDSILQAVTHDYNYQKDRKSVV